MGMFDDIRCHYPLPCDNLPAWVNKEHFFQTKDLECSLWRFEITEDGRLIQTWPVAPDGAWSDFHGDLEFYTGNCVIGLKDGTRYVEDGTGDTYTWLVFQARFTDGRLTRIALAERTDEPAQPRSAFKGFGV